MKKGVKKIGIIIGIIIGLLIITIGISFINHKIQLSKEDGIFIHNGKIVEVNGYEMHVYLISSLDVWNRSVILGTTISE